jgi:hypothetical protein
MQGTAPTPDTMSYLLLGLTVAALLVGGYVVSMFVRFRNLQKDAETLKQLEDEPR